MNRDDAIQALRENREWDVLVIGGGATGLGVAVDAASRGYATALLEAGDFAHGTSSRSTKLIHGGVRYLRQGNLALVRSGLVERARLLRNAPRLVTSLEFIIPAYAWHERCYYGAGLKLYDLLAGRGPDHTSSVLSRETVIERMPTLQPRGLRGGVQYRDSQFDDARLALVLAQTATRAGATVANYVRVVSFQCIGGRIGSVRARDLESGGEFEMRAKVVVNAGGIFADEIRRLEVSSSAPMLKPSQGSHLVLPARFLPGRHALMIPKTSDGRLLFAIPWLGRVLVGTTDTPVDRIEAAPVPRAEEIRYLLDHAGQFLAPAPGKSDILSVFAGLRPLAGSANGKSTSQLSRDHVVAVSPAGLVTISGGKWTTYRRMAEDAVNRAAEVAGLPRRPCATTDVLLSEAASEGASEPRLHPSLPVTAAAIRRAAREEMARTVDDVLARRTRALLLDARATLEIAPTVARLLGSALGWDEARERASLEAFRAIAARHLP